MANKLADKIANEKILELRGRLKLTQKQLGEILGVSYSILNR